MSELTGLVNNITEDNSSTISDSTSTMATTMAIATSSQITSRGGTLPVTTCPLLPAQARRRLFIDADNPADPEENLRRSRQELHKIAEGDMQRWNFNFWEGTPMDGKYKWEKISSVPHVYCDMHLQGTSSIRHKALPSALSLPATSTNTTITTTSRKSRALTARITSSIRSRRNLSFTDDVTTNDDTLTNINEVTSNNINTIISNERISVTKQQDNANNSSSSNTTTPATTATQVVSNAVIVTNNNIINNSCTSSKEDNTTTVPTSTIQRLQDKTSTSRQTSMTDFMSVRKRPISETTSKVGAQSGGDSEPREPTAKRTKQQDE